jgi:hypothetical protein
MNSAEWMPEVYPKSEPVWCPVCGEEFGIEKEIERAEKTGMRHLLEYLIAEAAMTVIGISDSGQFIEGINAPILESMLKQLEI